MIVMTSRVAVLLFELSVLGTTLPVFGQEGRQPAKVTTTERVSFARVPLGSKPQYSDLCN